MKTPFIVAGPCSAESPDQLLAVAEELKSSGRVQLFRAGVWKPRTRPNSFEGMGEIALGWLQDIKRATGLPLATEVASGKHVELALKYGIDVLWIGARTTANPFSVQEIADSLRGTNTPIMVKNPINADLQLWIGALERLKLAGITKLTAIHRGFSVAHKLEFRNDPLWRIPVEFKTKFPEIPILCDPSHITGDRKHIAVVAQKAMDLNFDGLMIETHSQPDLALSDSLQQVTPFELEKILSELVIKSELSKNSQFKNELRTLRTQIDQVDRELIRLLAERKNIVTQIAVAKINQKVTALQTQRFEQLMNERMIMAESLGLNENFIKEIFEIIHEDSIQNQTNFFELQLKKSIPNQILENH